MKRIIVDYAKLTHEIFSLLVDKFPDGYDDSNIIRFRNAQKELIEAVEVRTEDTFFLIKISTNLADRIENYDKDDEIANEIEPIEQDLNLDVEDDDIDNGDSLDKPDFNDDDESSNHEDDDDEAEDGITSDNNLPEKDDEDEK